VTLTPRQDDDAAERRMMKSLREMGPMYRMVARVLYALGEILERIDELGPPPALLPGPAPAELEAPKEEEPFTVSEFAVFGDEDAELEHQALLERLEPE
jgi:hypothetical protein